MSSTKKTRPARTSAQAQVKPTKAKPPADPQSPWEVFQLVAAEMKQNGLVFNQSFEHAFDELCQNVGSKPMFFGYEYPIGANHDE